MMLYIHVPFCASHCSYCAFYSTTSTALLESYYTTLLEELCYSDYLHGPIDSPITSIFFGGGTPSFIPASYIAHILETIYHRYPLAPNIEITLEANPESITIENAQIWKDAGVTRISMGCQSVIPEILLLLQRIHSVDMICHAIDIIHTIGFDVLSLDMIWGHCNHTVQRWLYELEHILSFDIQHLSCYALTVEENTTLAQQYHLHAQFPTEEEICDIYLAGKALLESKGFIQYEISNFARKGYECKHNQGYWNEIPYYGYGPSASSFNGTHRYTHPASIQQWASNITRASTTQSPLPNKEYRTTSIAYTEYLILNLRQRQGIHLPTINQYRRHPFEEYHKERIDTLLNAGLLEYQSPYIRLTEQGTLLIDSIITQFLDTKDEIIS